MQIDLDEAYRILKWAAKDFAKHGISNDDWYGDYEIWVHYNYNKPTEKPDHETQFPAAGL